MTSFYDWYADLPVASPQVFGDQTDVPESGDWWDASYLMMWGSNVPVTRTPDAHWMAEVRYRGTKVVSVSPDYSDNTKFADEWMPCAPGTDGAMAMAMGHVILSEFLVDRRTPFFVDYVQQYTDLPFLVQTGRARRLLRAREEPHRRRPGRRPAKARRSNRRCWTAAPARSPCRTARSASGTPTTASASGTWTWARSCRSSRFSATAAAQTVHGEAAPGSTPPTATPRCSPAACRCAGSESTCAARCST